MVEGMFMLPVDNRDAFELFASEPGVWEYHRRLSEHIREGAADLADQRKRSSKTRKARYRRDHWWVAFAMMLVAHSVEQKLREIEAKRKPPRTLSQMVGS
jgi:hypothetical protein